jgi:hypothetical protein
LNVKVFPHRAETEVAPNTRRPNQEGGVTLPVPLRFGCSLGGAGTVPGLDYPVAAQARAPTPQWKI